MQFVICREISNKKELYKGLRIRPEEEKVDLCEKIDVSMIVNTETIPRGLIFFFCDFCHKWVFNISVSAILT